jgi:FkbM family methyltransferase
LPGWICWNARCVDELDFHRALYRPGTIVDVGAHAGALALPLAELPGVRVIAFEPLPAAFARLEAAVRRRYGGIPVHVDLRAAALGTTTGEIVLEVPVVGGAVQEQWASTVKDYRAMRAGDARIEAVQRFTVPMLRLDDLGLPDVTAIKLDAEGAELEVLHGAAATLRRCRPVLSIEIEERHRPGCTRAVPAWLAGLGYQGFYEFWGDWRPIDGFDAAVLQRASPSPASFEVSDPYVFCFYFAPPERRAEFGRLARLDGGGGRMQIGPAA